MVIFYHKNSKITDVVLNDSEKLSFDPKKSIAHAIYTIALQHPTQVLVWCNESQKPNVDLENISQLFRHTKMLLSYNNTADNYFGKYIGYAENSFFLKINKAIRYPTWQMSSDVGAIHAKLIIAIGNENLNDTDFDYYLSSLAKRGLPKGIFCYSEPRLVKSIAKEATTKSSNNIFPLFKFVKQHYKPSWIFILFLNLLYFEKKFTILPLLNAVFFRKRTLDTSNIDQIELKASQTIFPKKTLDVLIPTIGRKNYIYDVLKRLSVQTYLPTNVIVIEQNPAEASASELDFLSSEVWPFAIKHHFTNQSGVCNARNIGLAMVESEVVFMADDDIIFEKNLIEKALESMQNIGCEVLLVSCHLEKQIVEKTLPFQFPIFGGGHAFVKTKNLEGLRFEMAYEFGYGEDGDFGMKLVNNGADIVFVSSPEIIHLKAPIGGFRTVHKQLWHDDEIQPKPAPTVMLFYKSYFTREQLLLYKTLLFMKNLQRSFFVNPFKYVQLFKKKWNRSVFWSEHLIQRK